MYSPDERPSSTRAAPAKKRIWSTIGGISSLVVSPTGLPVLRASAATSRAPACSTVSAIASSAACRSAGVVRFHSANAAEAAENAASTSAAVDRGAEAYTSPVAGSTTSV
jgi:hypothetical protein